MKYIYVCICGDNGIKSNQIKYPGATPQQQKNAIFPGVTTDLYILFLRKT